MGDRFEIDEPRNAKKKSGYGRPLVIVLIIFLVLAIIGGIGAAVYFFVYVPLFKTKEVYKDNKPVNPNDVRDRDVRIDCLPWLRNITDLSIEIECEKKTPFCIYQNVDYNKNVPSCYVDRDQRRMKIENEQPTLFGKSFSITYTNNDRAEIQLKIDFEYLDDFALRFKVIKAFKIL